MLGRLKKILKLGRRGSQLVEEGLLLGVSLVALVILLSLLTNIIASVKAAYYGSESALDKFLVEVLGKDLNELYNATIGRLVGGG